MGRTGRAMDVVRRVVDDAMIFASLLMLAWPVFFERVGRHGTWVWPIAVVVVLGAGVAKVSERWPLARYAPAAARGARGPPVSRASPAVRRCRGSRTRSPGGCWSCRGAARSCAPTGT
jgi:hypothetical protein